MTTSNQITPGMTISLSGKLFRVDSSVKVTVAKGTPFIKTKLLNLVTNEIVEKNFKVDQEIKAVSLEERTLEFLYIEGKKFLFLDISNLENVLVPADIVGKKAEYLKEGVGIKASFYGETIFSIELPQFLEIMVVSADDSKGDTPVSDTTKVAVLETGAKIAVPPFIEVGDIIKIDTKSAEYIQRV
jgi:elongation factor P